MIEEFAQSRGAAGPTRLFSIQIIHGLVEKETKGAAIGAWTLACEYETKAKKGLRTLA